MTRVALLKKLETMLASPENECMYGQIEIEIKGGEPTLLRKSATELLETNEGITRGRFHNR